MNKILCPRCAYKWNTKSTMLYVTCPNCRRTFSREENILGEENEN